MTLKDCFYMDIKEYKKKVTFREILSKFLFSPGYKAVVYFRLSQYFAKRISIISHFLFIHNFKVTGAEINLKAKIGQGFRIAHPNGIVIGAGVIIKKRVTIYQGVTLGTKRVNSSKGENNLYSYYPTVEDNVVIYAGAKIIGPVTIGRNSIIGANAVVLESIPPNSVAVGNPAKVVKTKD